MKTNYAVLVAAAILVAVAFGAGWMAAPWMEIAQQKGGGAGACAERVDAVFSPGAEAEIVALIESANESIEVELFQFSYEPLMDALADARERGVRVRVILEPRLDGDDNLKAMRRLKGSGVDARWASLSFSRTHSKTAVVDGRRVLVGSPNWSYSAMFRNRESAVIIESSEVAGEFERVFEEDWGMAKAG